MAALAAASGIPPRNMPKISVSDRLPNPLNLAPITKHPGMVSRRLPSTMARPEPRPASMSILLASPRLKCSRLSFAIFAQAAGFDPPALRLVMAQLWLSRSTRARQSAFTRHEQLKILAADLQKVDFSD